MEPDELRVAFSKLGLQEYIVEPLVKFLLSLLNRIIKVVACTAVALRFSFFGEVSPVKRKLVSVTVLYRADGLAFLLSGRRIVGLSQSHDDEVRVHLVSNRLSKHLLSVIGYDKIRLPLLDIFHISCVKGKHAQILILTLLLKLENLVRISSVESLLDNFYGFDDNRIICFSFFKCYAKGYCIKSFVFPQI